MRMIDIILRKRSGFELTKFEIEFFIKGYVSGEIPDYQVSSLLMAICFNGMTKEETSNLTMAMAYSGDVVDLSAIPGTKVDKHSTGGVGDTTTLIVVPLVAACGVPVAKMSGRGLGHTGGTIDKLESIPGFNPNLTNERFLDTVRNIGLSVVGQTGNLVPADKKLYALRDVTGTVESISLIASSVMSKKIAAGADAIVLDVKAGKGAFMKTAEDAFTLAREMVSIGKNVGRKTIALVTDMNQPLGNAVGNALEVKEAIGVLNGEIKGEIREVSLLLASYMLLAAGKCQSLDEAAEAVEVALEKGKGADKFKQMIVAHGGDGRIVEDCTRLKTADTVIEVQANENGYIGEIEAMDIGNAAMLLGAGRAHKEDVIDYSTGVLIKKRIGDKVLKGESVASLYVNKEVGAEEAIKLVSGAFKILKERVVKNPVVLGSVLE